MSILNKLTEGIVNRSLAKDGQALMSKWENTGLLEGLNNESSKNTMACLLENQAKELSHLFQYASEEAMASVAEFYGAHTARRAL